MKKKKFNKLEWNVLIAGFNGKEITTENIIRDDLLDDLKKLVKKPYTYADVKETIRKWAMYHYWCKSEFEVLVTDLWGDNERKIDAYTQVEMNLDRLTEYIIRELEL